MFFFGILGIRMRFVSVIISKMYQGWCALCSVGACMFVPPHRISASISYELHMGTDTWYLSMQTLTANASRVIEPFSKCIRIHVTKTEEHICPVSCVGHFCRKKTRKRRYFWQTDILHNLHMKKIARNSCKIWTFENCNLH